jgi:muramoyltetrapeptide carboxypeptidase
MAQNHNDIVLPAKLQLGDRVRFVSPASTPTRGSIKKAQAALEGLGLTVKIGKHVFDTYGYLAGNDKDRLADLNDALRDPDIKAVIATRGGKGAYRIANGIDFEAIRKNPKLVVGFSEITILHMAIWQHCHLAGLHGAAWNMEQFGQETTDSFHRAVMTTEPITVTSRPAESTYELTTQGTATGILLGGNQDSIATAAGWALPHFNGCILLLEAFNLRLGHIDRQLTMLKNAGYLEGIKGIAIGQYTECGADSTTQGDWTVNDVLRDRLGRLGVPILGGLPIGHGEHPIAIPIGTMATLDTNAGTLTIASGVKS